MTVPRRFGGAVERPLLIDRLRRGIDGQIVVLQASTGFGKTELLAAAFENLQEPGDHFAWLTVSAEDSAPHFFLNDVAEAFGLGSGLAGPEIEIDAAVQKLLGRLAATHARHVLVLDDFQTVSGAAIAGCMELLVRNLPNNVRVIIASSSRPAIPLSRFRLRGLLTELRARDLAFSRLELKRLVGKRLSEAELDSFATITGGWPALVQLALPFLGEAPDSIERQAILSGAHRDFRDFIVEEIVPRVPPDMREALAVCSILTEFPIDLAEHLAGVTVEQRSVRDLEDYAPIIVPVDQRPGWYRLHPVVGATFAAQLDDQPTAKVAALHSRAASWFAARGHLEKAVTHASRAGDFVLAAEAIRHAGGVNLFIRAGHTVLERLIEPIPAADIYRSPTLTLCYVMVLAKRGRMHAAREVLQDLKSTIEAEGGADGQAISIHDFAHIEGLIDIYEDCQLEDLHIDRLEHAVRHFGPKDTWQRGWVYNYLCIAYTRSGQLDLARSCGLRALACYREERTAYAEIFMLVHLSLVTVLMGRPSAAILLAREAEELAQRTQWSDRNLLSIIRVPLAEALYQQSDIASAETMLREGMAHVARGEGWIDLFMRGFGTLARTHFCQSGLEAALAVVDRAEEVAVERNLPRLRLGVDILRLEFFTRAGMLESALHLSSTMPSLEDFASWPTWREWSDASVAQSRLLTRTGNAKRALGHIDALLDHATSHQHGMHLLCASVVAIEANWAAGRSDEALQTLQRAIALARPQEWLQVFLDEGQPLSLVVRAIVRRFGLSTFSPKTAEFVSRIAGALNQASQVRTGARSDLLSTREIEVLRLLAKDCANKEIARELGLSESTVKFHLKNIFAKIGVSRRRLAVSVGLRIGLID